MTDNDAVFWERLHDMPDVEAEIELVLRRHALTDENAALIAFRVGRYGSEADEAGMRLLRNQAALTRLTEELKMRRRRMERANWAAAVTALYGQEGYAACRLWIEQMCVEPGRNTNDERARK